MLSVVVLSFVMPSVVVLSFVMLSFVMLSVGAQSCVRPYVIMKNVVVVSVVAPNLELKKGKIFFIMIFIVSARLGQTIKKLFWRQSFEQISE
jgi:hypothetical protein